VEEPTVTKSKKGVAGPEFKKEHAHCIFFYVKGIVEAWETIRENIKISAKESLGYYELKKHKP
jgi:hypothetical protein